MYRIKDDIYIKNIISLQCFFCSYFYNYIFLPVDGPNSPQSYSNTDNLSPTRGDVGQHVNLLLKYTIRQKPLKNKIYLEINVSF